VKPFDRRLLRYARATRGYLAVCVGLGVATAVVVVAQATLLAHGISAAVTDGAGRAELRTTLVALAVVLAARAGLVWAQEVSAQRASAAVKSELRTRLLAHLARLGPGSGTRGSGELATLATRGVDALDPYFARYLPQLVLAALVPAVVVVRMVPADLIAAATVAVTLPLIPLFMALVGMRTQALTRSRFRLLGRLSHHFLDVVGGLGVLKAFGRAHAQAETIRAVTDQYRRATLRTLRVAFLSALVLELLATLSVALVAVGVGLRLVAGELSFETALLVLILAPEAYLPLRKVGANFHASAEGLAAAGGIFAVLETPLPEGGGRTDVPDLCAAELRVDGLTVRHAGRATAAPDGLSLRIRPGEFVALAGPSGCGKSTLLRVLLGFTAPDGGSVRVDGQDVREFDPELWRRQIAWVPQRPHLFAGTIADNIRLGDPAASAEAVRQVARLARVDDFADALPAGLDTVLGEDGAGLSAGQRRRVAVARAFLRDAPLVLLDEPTADLDADSEEALLAAIADLARDRTVLAVSHRPALLALADRVELMAAAGAEAAA
jgi:thiol reductant ABC exporter CydD subunit